MQFIDLHINLIFLRKTLRNIYISDCKIGYCSSNQHILKRPVIIGILSNVPPQINFSKCWKFQVIIRHLSSILATQEHLSRNYYGF